MESVFMMVAWAIGLLSLLLVGDMVAADIRNRRAERVLAYAPKHLWRTRS